ncbi:hypothetical protein ACIPV2_00180 [Microbacterium sp. NPDC089987]|uniref:hypothetical protein n=1 Tax=Microbacterium sp. NPDC089987 TaxID=3364202 RepID=UPI0037F79E65
MGAEGQKSAKLKCFVVSTIGEPGSKEREDADLVLEYLVKPAVGDNYEVTRGDEDSNPGAITPQIVESILEADLVVADLTSFNPNVYYEVAIAHGYERPTVHLQIASERPAFDLKDMRLVRYNLTNPRDLATAVKTLRDFATYASEHPAKVKTPLSGAKQFLQIEESGDPIAQSNLEIIEQIRRLRSEVRRALRPNAAEQHSADIRSLRMIIDRVRRRGVLREKDLIGVISQATSTGFDSWVRDLATELTGERDVDMLNELLFDAELLGMRDPSDEPDEPQD